MDDAKSANRGRQMYAGVCYCSGMLYDVQEVESTLLSTGAAVPVKGVGWVTEGGCPRVTLSRLREYSSPCNYSDHVPLGRNRITLTTNPSTDLPQGHESRCVLESVVPVPNQGWGTVNMAFWYEAARTLGFPKVSFTQRWQVQASNFRSTCVSQHICTIRVSCSDIALKVSYNSDLADMGDSDQDRLAMDLQLPFEHSADLYHL